MSATNDSMPPIRGGTSFVMISVGAISSAAQRRQIATPACDELLRRDIQNRPDRLVEGPPSIELPVELVQLPGRIVLDDVVAGQPRLGVGEIDVLLGSAKPVVRWESLRNPTRAYLAF